MDGNGMGTRQGTKESDENQSKGNAGTRSGDGMVASNNGSGPAANDGGNMPIEAV